MYERVANSPGTRRRRVVNWRYERVDIFHARRFSEREHRAGSSPLVVENHVHLLYLPFLILRRNLENVL